jgi:hypothetical protein
LLAAAPPMRAPATIHDGATASTRSHGEHAVADDHGRRRRDHRHPAHGDEPRQADGIRRRHQRSSQQGSRLSFRRFHEAYSPLLPASRPDERSTGIGGATNHRTTAPPDRL